MGPEPEAAYAALCQAYAPRNPFRELGHGHISLNTFRILLQALPPDSALHRAIPEMQGWTVGDYLLARAVDAMNWNTSVLVAVNGDGKVERPELVVRPKDSAEQQQADAQEAADQQAAIEWFEQQMG